MNHCFLLISLLEPLMQHNLDASFLGSQAVLDHLVNGLCWLDSEISYFSFKFDGIQVFSFFFGSKSLQINSN